MRRPAGAKAESPARHRARVRGDVRRVVAAVALGARVSRRRFLRRGFRGRRAGAAGHGRNRDLRRRAGALGDGDPRPRGRRRPRAGAARAARAGRDGALCRPAPACGHRGARRRPGRFLAGAVRHGRRRRGPARRSCGGRRRMPAWLRHAMCPLHQRVSAFSSRQVFAHARGRTRQLEKSWSCAISTIWNLGIHTAHCHHDRACSCAKLPPTLKACTQAPHTYCPLRSTWLASARGSALKSIDNAQHHAMMIPPCTHAEL